MCHGSRVVKERPGSHTFKSLYRPVRTGGQKRGPVRVGYRGRLRITRGGGAERQNREQLIQLHSHWQFCWVQTEPSAMVRVGTATGQTPPQSRRRPVRRDGFVGRAPPPVAVARTGWKMLGPCCSWGNAESADRWGQEKRVRGWHVVRLAKWFRQQLRGGARANRRRSGRRSHYAGVNPVTVTSLLDTLAVWRFATAGARVW